MGLLIEHWMYTMLLVENIYVLVTFSRCCQCSCIRYLEVSCYSLLNLFTGMVCKHFCV